jgi:nucleotide-binding universal stress UspA family protein
VTVPIPPAHAAVAATESPVAISDQIVTGDPKTELIRASRSATLLCVGALGRGHFTHGHVGSTAEALASAAHCPVIIIRDNTKSPAAQDGWVIAVADESLESSNVVELGVSEALIRHAPLRIVQALATTGEARNRLDRYVAHWAHRHPELRVDTEVVHGQILDILTRLADNIRLVVVGAHDVATHRDLFGAGGYAALRDSDCPLLVANRRRTL